MKQLASCAVHVARGATGNRAQKYFEETAFVSNKMLRGIQESQHCHFITPLHQELEAQGRAETTLDREWEYLFLSRLGNYKVVAIISKSCRLYGPWFSFGKVERLSQKNFSLQLLRPCSRTFSRPPVARAQAIAAHVTLPHQAPSAWAEQALGSLVISPLLCSSAHMGC